MFFTNCAFSKYLVISDDRESVKSIEHARCNVDKYTTHYPNIFIEDVVEVGPPQVGGTNLMKS